MRYIKNLNTFILLINDFENSPIIGKNIKIDI